MFWHRLSQAKSIKLQSIGRFEKYYCQNGYDLIPNQYLDDRTVYIIITDKKLKREMLDIEEERKKHKREWRIKRFKALLDKQ